MLTETFFLLFLTCVAVSGKGARCAVKKKDSTKRTTFLMPPLTNFEEAKTEKCIYDDLMSWKDLW